MAASVVLWWGGIVVAVDPVAVSSVVPFSDPPVVPFSDPPVVPKPETRQVVQLQTSA